MSWQESDSPLCKQQPCSSIKTVITPRAKNIGDFDVRRALPASEQQRVGPFIFFDQMGPVVFKHGQAMDVRPHPHIGLSTITWLFEGEIDHQDSLGYHQTIRPGEVNWMTAGKGIVHSERSPGSQRNTGASLAGIQAWLALPVEKEEMQASFKHYSKQEIPVMKQSGLEVCLIAGSAWGMHSPVKVESDTLYAEIRLQAGYHIEIPADYEERALYVYQGEISVDGAVFGNGSMIILNPSLAVELGASQDAICMLLGGAPIAGERFLYWNFVASSEQKIEQAKQDWSAGRFAGIDGDEEFIPLPE